jgi:long-chain fatty acid transport protein
MLMTGLAGTAHAAGFALIEQNASGLGNAYAGAAAVAQDASTVYFNPAGLSLLPDSQVVLAAHAIKPRAEFSGTVSPAVGGGDGGDAGDWAFVPSLYYAHRLTPAIHLGIGINAPFGLKTEYDDDWMGRYQALKSEVKTINVNPSIAWKINDQVSIGAGFSYQRIEATLTNDISPLVPGSHMKVEGDDYGWGYNLGLLWQAGKDTRVGLAYRSEVDYTLDGTLKANAVLPSGDVEADVTLPASASLSLFHKLSPSVDILADVTWTGWSSFDELAVVYTQLPVPLPPTPENWDDILRYSLGATWHMDDKLSLRAGLAYDEAPVSDKYRTPRIPDGARTWVAIGGQYRLSKQGALDFGYAHLFVDDPGLMSSGGGTTLNGSYDGAVDIISVQYTHTF